MLLLLPVTESAPCMTHEVSQRVHAVESVSCSSGTSKSGRVFGEVGSALALPSRVHDRFRSVYGDEAGHDLRILRGTCVSSSETMKHGSNTRTD